MLPANKSHTYTANQTEFALQQIATWARALSGHLCNDGCIHVAAAMAEHIGAFADHMSGAGVVGDLAAWSLVPESTQSLED